MNAIRNIALTMLIMTALFGLSSAATNKPCAEHCSVGCDIITEHMDEIKFYKFLGHPHARAILKNNRPKLHRMDELCSCTGGPDSSGLGTTSQQATSTSSRGISSTSHSSIPTTTVAAGDAWSEVKRILR